MVFSDLENRIFSLCRQGVSPLSAYTSAYIYILSYTLSNSWVGNRLSSCFSLRLFQPAVVSAHGCVVLFLLFLFASADAGAVSACQ